MNLAPWAVGIGKSASADGTKWEVAAKQHVISTHARDQLTHITKVCVKAVPTPDGLF
jgi:hypothetical protein